MPAADIVKEMREESKRQKQNALKELDAFAREKIELKRPVFFVPGWTDESGMCWKIAYRKGDIPIKNWIEKIAGNHNIAEYITFTEKESKRCMNFFDFADILKERIWQKIKQKEKIDIVGYSMGGLNSVSAVIDDDKPLLNVHNLLTIATPHQGTQFGGIAYLIKKYDLHIASQCLNFDPDYPLIKIINKLEARQTLLKRINKLYCLLGTHDRAVGIGGRYKQKGLNPELYKRKVEVIRVSGATHSQKDGITQDPRAVLAVIKILVGIKLDQHKGNQGYIYPPTQSKGAACPPMEGLWRKDHEGARGGSIGNKTAAW